MAMELMGAKLVAPFYGGSLYVWTAVLTITVLGLTLGYYAGGRLSRKRPSEKILFIILGISAVLVLALPLTASIAIALTKGMGLIVGICITCALLLLPPMFCFGMVGPMVVALMSSQLETVGKTAGTVYFTSTLGGIAATFFFGLYFIPVAGLRLCAIITGLALAALPARLSAKRAFGRENVVARVWEPVPSRISQRDRPEGGGYSKTGEQTAQQRPIPAGKTHHLPVCRARRRNGDGGRADFRANGCAVFRFVALRLGNGHRLYAAGARDRLFSRWRHRRQIHAALMLCYGCC